MITKEGEIDNQRWGRGAAGGEKEIGSEKASGRR